MKVFYREKKPDGCRYIYLFGVKIIEYKKKNKKKQLNNIDFYRSLGVKIGNNTKFIVYPHADDHPNFGSEPFLIEIGDNCLISFGCIFLTHDGSVSVCKTMFPDNKNINKFGKIRIGNNVFIGCHSIIMPNVSVGNNVVIGAGSVVTKDIPDGEVWAGNPAKFIKSTEEYVSKCLLLSETHEQVELKNFIQIKKQELWAGETNSEIH